MLITESAGKDDLVRRDGEFGYGRVPGLEILAQNGVVRRADFGPFDEVIGFHAVQLGAHAHLAAVFGGFHHGHVGFAGADGLTVVKQFHRLAAADHGADAVMDDFGHGASLFLSSEKKDKTVKKRTFIA